MSGAPTSAVTPVRAKSRGPWFVGGLPGPVFAKDVWILGKRPSTTWIRLVYSLILLTVVGLVFGASIDSTRNAYGYAGTALALQRSQEVAPAVTVAIMWSQFVMLAIIGAAMGAPAISDEVRAGSLATLLTTPLKATQIVLGKVMSRMVELSILALVSLPLLLAIRTYGGVPATNTLLMVGICLAMGLLAVQVGIFFSIRFKRPAGPLVLSVLVIAVLTMLLPGILAILAQVPNFAANQRSLMFAAALMSPQWAMVMNTATLMNDGGVPGMGDVVTQSLAAIGVTLMWWLLFFVLSCLMLRRSMRAEERVKSRGPKLAVAAVSAGSAAATTAATTGDNAPTKPMRKRRTGTVQAGMSREVSDRPILWRELQQPMLGRRWMAWTGGILIGLAALFIYYVSGLEGVQIALAIVGTVVWLLFAAVATTGCISQEREGRTLDVLLTTPLSGWEIVWGKFMGGMRRLWIGPAIIMLHVLLSGCLANYLAGPLSTLDPFTGIHRWQGGWTPDVVHPLALIMIPLVLLGPIALLAASGVWLSTVLKRSTAAAICNLALALGVWLVVPIFLLILFAGMLNSGEKIVTLWLMPNPVLLIGSVIDGCMRDESIWVRQFSFVGPDDIDVSLPAYVIGLCVICGLYLGATLFCLRLAAGRIAQGTGRAK